MAKIIQPGDIAQEVCGDVNFLSKAVAGLQKFPTLADFAKSVKVNVLETADLPPVEDCAIGGLYGTNGPECRIVMNTNTEGKILYAAWVPGKLHTVAHGTDEQENKTALLVHELGHHVDRKLVYGNLPLFRFTRRAMVAGYEAGQAISKYANSSPVEYFAESFCAYLYHPEDLQKYDPMMFEAVKQTGL
jgi:hypothetical protein